MKTTMYTIVICNQGRQVPFHDITHNQIVAKATMLKEAGLTFRVYEHVERNIDDYIASANNDGSQS